MSILQETLDAGYSDRKDRINAFRDRKADWFENQAIQIRTFLLGAGIHTTEDKVGDIFVDGDIAHLQYRLEQPSLLFVRFHDSAESESIAYISCQLGRLEHVMDLEIVVCDSFKHTRKDLEDLQYDYEDQEESGVFEFQPFHFQHLSLLDYLI